MSKRPEITPREFAKAIESQPIASIPFDPRMFGTAANNGQMIAEISANHRTSKMFLADRATADGPRRDQKAAKFVPVADHQEATGKNGLERAHVPRRFASPRSRLTERAILN